MNGYAILGAGLALFFIPHLFAAFRSREAGGLAAKMGRGPYMGLFSLVSLAGFGLIIWGFVVARTHQPMLIWRPPTWAQHANLALMAPAMVALASAYLPAGYIRKMLKHPMLVSVKIWAAGHLLANGELVSILLFGSFLAFAVIDRIAVAKRGDRGAAEASPQVMGDFLALLIGGAAYAGMLFWGHQALIGVPVLP